MGMKIRSAVVASFGLGLLVVCTAQATDTLGDQVGAGVGLAQEERAALLPVLAHYYAMEGSKEVLSQVLGKSIDCGCRGSCMVEAVGLVNHEMRSGLEAGEACRDVGKALEALKDISRQKGVEPKPEVMARALRGIFEMGNRNREGDRVIVGGEPGN